MQRCVNISRPGGGLRGRVSGVLETSRASHRSVIGDGQDTGRTPLPDAGPPLRFLLLRLFLAASGRFKAFLPSTDRRAVRKGQLRWLGTCLALTHSGSAGVSCEMQEIRLFGPPLLAHQAVHCWHRWRQFLPPQEEKKNIQMINGNWAAGPKAPAPLQLEVIVT
jgi:hypothetical protein